MREPSYRAVAILAVEFTSRELNDLCMSEYVPEHYRKVIEYILYLRSKHEIHA